MSDPQPAVSALDGHEANTLAGTLAAIVGAANVLADEPSRALAGADLVRWPGQVVPDLVVRPRSTDEVAATAAALHRAGRAMVPRGAGLSYTGGVVPRTSAVAIDLTAFDDVRIDAEDLVAVVGAGCTWEKLARALEPHGLEVVVSSVISGSHSTIGGAASQGVPGSMDGIVALTVVLADGTLVRTGSWSLSRSKPFWRHHGPDLTGLFLADCGAFGIKTEIALRLRPKMPLTFESYAFETSSAMIAALVAVMRQGLAARAIAFDRAKADTARPEGAMSALRTAAAVASRAGSLRQAVRDVASLGRASGALAQTAWSLHLTIASPTEAGLAAQAQAVREICDATGERMEPAVPKALHARPYSVRGFVGPDGERWVPIHGWFAPSRAASAMADMEAYLDARKAELGAAGIRNAWLVSSSGPHVNMEPMLYWRDELDPIHFRYLSDRNRTQFAGVAPAPATRALVAEVRAGLRDIMDRHGAAHGQIGRYYMLTDHAGTADALARIKSALDPTGGMNPGVLGL